MKYTKFFAGYVNTQGSPNLQPDQFKQLMNLIHLEGQIAGIDRVIEKFKHIDNPQKYEFVKVSIHTCRTPSFVDELILKPNKKL